MYVCFEGVKIHLAPVEEGAGFLQKQYNSYGPLPSQAFEENATEI